MSSFNIDSPIKELGILLGIFTENSDGTLAFNSSWFNDPMSYVQSTFGSNPATLFNLLDACLPTTYYGDSNGFWHQIASGDGISSASFYVVTPPVGSNVIGFGIQCTLFTEDLVMEFKAYMPMIQATASGCSFVLGSTANPVNLSVKVSNMANGFTLSFATNNMTFESFEYIIFISQSGGAPSITSNIYVDGISTTTTFSPTAADFISGIVNHLLTMEDVKSFLASRLIGNCTVGNLLAALQLLQLPAAGSGGTTGNYTINSNFNTILTTPPITYLRQVFDSLLEQDIVSMPIGLGTFSIVKSSNINGSKYGFNFQFPDIELFGAPNSQNPTIVLQLGSWVAGETTNTSWLGRTIPGYKSRPGINIYLLEDNGSGFQLSPSFEAVSIGVDILPSASLSTQGIINFTNFSLGFVQIRCMIQSPSLLDSNWQTGVCILFGDVGIPLGQTLNNTTGSSNPVAQNLLASRGGNQSTGTSGDAVNPSFSVSLSTAQTNNGYFAPAIQLYDEAYNLSNQVWLPVQRSFGPLQCDSIGVNWNNTTGNLVLLFNGSVALPSFTVRLIGLQVQIPISNAGSVANYTLDLDGLDLHLKSGTTEIKAALNKTVNGTTISYEGQALIKVGRFLISAQGAYTTLSGQPSLFIFACLNTPLGGPPVFFVEGLAAGFGYNRDLILPEVDQVDQFPLIAGMSATSLNPITESTSLNQAMGVMGDWVPPSVGKYWLAAGLTFSSFKTIETRALFALKLGQSPQFSLTGISVFQLPKQPAGTVYANVEIGFVAVFNPEEGYFSAIAQITSRSYLFSQNCRLTGGIAFKTWYNGPHKGDFVLSVGGYHPAFSKPDYYPSVPRLGFQWPISQQIQISGGCYFALTPSCAMAGGWLNASYSDNVLGGELSASFNVNTDILIRWKPFNFLAHFGISINAAFSYDVAWWTVTKRAQIGADLEMWGPPVGGKFKVKYSVVSITIDFGAPISSLPSTVDWSTFQSSLPAAANIISAAPGKGLISTANDSSGNEIWTVSNADFEFRIESAIPISQCTLSGSGVNSVQYSGSGINIRPMGAQGINSTLSVSISNASGTMNWNQWQVINNTAALPEALWGVPLSDNNQPGPSANLVSGLFTGLSTIKPVPNAMTGAIECSYSNFLIPVFSGVNPGLLPLSATEEPYQTAIATDTKSTDIIATTITTQQVVNQRNQVFNMLNSFGVGVTTNEALTHFATDINTIFQVNPMIGEPGSQLAA